MICAGKLWWLRWQRQLYRRRTRDVRMASFLASPVPRANLPTAQVEFLAVDLETTSLDPLQGEIVSFGWVPIRRERIRLAEAEHHYVAITQGVGQSAVFHQIGDDDLADARSVAGVMAHFLAVAAGKVLVFHNARLDMAFLNVAANHLYGVPIIAPAVDTFQLEKKKILRVRENPAPGELRLFACRERYGLPDYPAHDALTDAIATAELLLAQVAYRAKGARLCGFL